MRQGRVVSRMLKNPEQEWAGAVAPAFELVVWGCGQLDGGTAGCVLVLPGVLGCPRFWAVGELLSGFFLSSFSSALAGGRWFGNEAHEGGRGLQSPCSGERRGTGASHPSCKSSRAPALCLLPMQESRCGSRLWKSRMRDFTLLGQPRAARAAGDCCPGTVDLDEVCASSVLTSLHLAEISWEKMWGFLSVRLVKCCLERLWSLYLWRYLEPTGSQSWAASSR